MQRVRMSLPYFRKFGWEAEVVTVDPVFSEMVKDNLLIETLPADVPIHYVSAFPKAITAKIGLGSIGLRSLYYYKKKVNELLRSKSFDLIYFSTTQFPVTILGRYWKQKFNIPYIIDFQDPWHSTYYLDKPKSQRPPKHWFSYRLNKYLEPYAIKKVSGLISVSDSYLETLRKRYPWLKDIPAKTITFGHFHLDVNVVSNNDNEIPLPFVKSPEKIHLVYVGRGGYDMQPAVTLLFTAFRDMLQEDRHLYGQIRFSFMGTSYAPKGFGKKTIFPIALQLGVSAFVEEFTDRILYYESLKALYSADGLVIPGSDDQSYTASKIYPYILVNKPLLGIFNKKSSSYQIIQNANAGIVCDLGGSHPINEIKDFLKLIVSNPKPPITDWEFLEQYSAEKLTGEQCSLFESIL